MQRSKMRKAVAVLPKWMAPQDLVQALGAVRNERTRARLRARFHRRGRAA